MNVWRSVSIIIPDIPIRLVEKLRVLVELVLEQGLAQGLAHLASPPVVDCPPGRRT